MNNEQCGKVFSVLKVTKDKHGYKTYDVWIGDKVEVFSAYELLKLMQNSPFTGITVENAKIRKVFGKDTIELSDTVERQNLRDGQSVKMSDMEINHLRQIADCDLIRYVNNARERGITILDLGPIQVDTATYRVRKNENIQNVTAAGKTGGTGTSAATVTEQSEGIRRKHCKADVIGAEMDGLINQYFGVALERTLRSRPIYRREIWLSSDDDSYAIGMVKPCNNAKCLNDNEDIIKLAERRYCRVMRYWQC